MIRDALSHLLTGETITIAGAVVERVGLIHYAVNGGPWLRLDAAVEVVEAQGRSVVTTDVDGLRKVAVDALAQYRIKLPADRVGLVKLAKKLRLYPDAEPQAAAEAVEAVLAVVVEIEEMEAA